MNGRHYGSIVTAKAETSDETDVMARAIRGGDRRALARAITRVESTRSADRERAETLLTRLLPASGKARRIGISGAPGSGKSTFIEAFGLHLTGKGLKVAVLAVDPSSRRSGGSILGDKTRMEKLARDPGAFIRPSPTGATLGGVARRTREVMLLVEAAGFDVVLVETVGVGQSETAVSEMVDLFVLLVSPGGGDDLQGIKRGVMELADLILVTKSDGELEQAAGRAAADYHAALHLMRPKYPGLPPEVLRVSALKHKGIAGAWTAMSKLHTTLAKGGHLKRLRQAQARAWFRSEVQAVLADAIAADPQTAEAARRIEADVVEGRLLPDAAARELIRTFRG
jgi:LAO/AO transport system kinase